MFLAVLKKAKIPFKDPALAQERMGLCYSPESASAWICSDVRFPRQERKGCLCCA